MLQSCFTSTETVRIIRDGDVTSSFIQLLSSYWRYNTASIRTLFSFVLKLTGDIIGIFVVDIVVVYLFVLLV